MKQTIYTMAGNSCLRRITSLLITKKWKFTSWPILVKVRNRIMTNGGNPWFFITARPATRFTSHRR